MLLVLCSHLFTFDPQLWILTALCIGLKGLHKCFFLLELLRQGLKFPPGHLSTPLSCCPHNLQGNLVLTRNSRIMLPKNSSKGYPWNRGIKKLVRRRGQNTLEHDKIYGSLLIRIFIHRLYFIHFLKIRYAHYGAGNAQSIQRHYDYIYVIYHRSTSQI